MKHTSVSIVDSLDDTVWSGAMRVVPSPGDFVTFYPLNEPEKRTLKVARREWAIEGSADNMSGARAILYCE